jgi:TP901 family phage tail tape measure protein
MQGAGAVALGSAYGDILIDTSQVNRQMNRAFDQIGQRFGGFLENIGGGMQRAGGALTALTAPLLAFGATGIRTAANFDDAMREIQARTGSTAEEMDALRATAMQMGADTVFSASEAANAMLQLLTSGQSVEETLQTLPHIMNLAAAAGTDLGSTADWVTDIMAQFGLEADQAGLVVDALVRAAGSGSATVTDLAMGFQNAGGIANNFGLDVYETAAALQIFSENGIKGAEAGTQLKSMLTNMTRNTNEVQDMWDQLGVSMYDAEGNMRSLDDVIADLSVAMEDMTEQQRIEAIQTLAGSYGQAGLTALLASGGIDEMQGKMAEAADAATVADSRMGGWNGAVEALGGSIETLQITVLTPLINAVLIPLINKITEITNKVTEWAKANPELAQKIGMVLLAVAVLGPALVVLGTVISSLGTVIGVASTALTAFGGVGLIVAGLVAAYAANFGGFRDAIDGIGEAIQEGDIVGLIGGIGAALYALPKGIAKEILGEEAWKEGIEGWKTARDAIVAFGGWVWDQVKDGLGDIAENLLFDLVYPMAGFLLTGDLQPVVDGALRLGGKVLSGILSVWDDLNRWILDHLIQPVADALGLDVNLSSIYDQAVAIGSSILDYVLDGIADLPGKLIDFLNDAIPNEIDLGSFSAEIDAGILGSRSVSVDFGSIDLPDNPIPRKMGGLIRAGEVYSWKEAGDELFMAGDSGYMYPHDVVESLRGGGDTYQIENRFEITPEVLRDPGLMDKATQFAEQIKSSLRKDGGGLAGANA